MPTIYRYCLVAHMTMNSYVFCIICTEQIKSIFTSFSYSLFSPFSIQRISRLVILCNIYHVQVFSCLTALQTNTHVPAYLCSILECLEKSCGNKNDESVPVDTWNSLRTLQILMLRLQYFYVNLISLNYQYISIIRSALTMYF